MSDVTLIASALDNILIGSVVSSDHAPSTSYDLDTLLTMDPAARVLFGVKTLTITFTLGAPALGDVFVLPVSNLDAGSPMGARLTTNTGLDVGLSVDALPRDSLPATLAVDLALADTNAAHRTASVWHLVISGNSVNVAIGGAIGIYPKQILDPDLRMGFTLERTHAVKQLTNEYRARYIQDFRTADTKVTATTRCDANGVATLRDLYDANHGIANPGLLWPQGYIFSAMLGTFQETFKAQHVEDTLATHDYYDVTLIWQELGKGLPL